MKLFYEPNNAYFGDCMPFYHDDTFYVFHQRDARNPRPFEPFEWSLATTKDFVHYEDKGVAIPKEGDDFPEQYIFAGSVFEGNHKFHAIYTAYNRDFAGLHQKICRNGILRAIFGHLKHSRCMKCRICLKWVTGGIYLPQNTVNEVKQSIG